MKQLKKSGIYKANNVTFDPQKMEAFSYGWWQFVIRLKTGEILFNSFRYSQSTGGQQRKVRDLMAELQIPIDLTVEVPGGFQEHGWEEKALSHLLCKWGTAAIEAEFCRKSNRERAEQQVLDLEIEIGSLARITGIEVTMFEFKKAKSNALEARKLRLQSDVVRRDQRKAHNDQNKFKADLKLVVG